MWIVQAPQDSVRGELSASSPKSQLSDLEELILQFGKLRIGVSPSDAVRVAIRTVQALVLTRFFYHV